MQNLESVAQKIDDIWYERGYFRQEVGEEAEEDIFSTDYTVQTFFHESTKDWTKH